MVLQSRNAPPRCASLFASALVSLFADMTYEGAYSIIGPFLKDLGASAAAVGLIAGLGEMIAASLRYFSGRLVDRTRAYWAVAICGYFLNLVVVPAMAFAGNWQMAALLVVVERTGKSLRGPARDVLLSEATGKIGHGWGFGVHAAMDQTGAVLGPLMMAAAVMRIAPFRPRLPAPGVSRRGRAGRPAGGALRLSPGRPGHAARRCRQKTLPRGLLDVRSGRRRAGPGVRGLPVAGVPLPGHRASPNRRRSRCCSPAPWV